METIPWNAAAASMAGVIAVVVTLVVIYALLLLQPHRIPFNPLYLAGSSLSMSVTPAYASGLLIILSAGIGYSIFISAVFTGFGLTSALPAWGALVGSAEWIMTGVTLGYMRLLNRTIRSGRLAAPGPFMLSYGPPTMLTLLAAHMVFGAVAGGVYSAIA